MAEFTLDGEKITIPKFKLREIRAAAPFIDAVIATRRRTMTIAGRDATTVEIAQRLEAEGGAMSWLIESLGDLVRVIGIGVLHARKERPYDGTSIEAVAELIEGDLDMDNLGALNTTFDDICREAGMLRELPLAAPASEAGADLSSSEQSESSQSSSLPAAVPVTGSE